MSVTTNTYQVIEDLWEGHLCVATSVIGTFTNIKAAQNCQKVCINRDWFGPDSLITAVYSIIVVDQVEADLLAKYDGCPNDYRPNS